MKEFVATLMAKNKTLKKFEPQKQILDKKLSCRRESGLLKHRLGEYYEADRSELWKNNLPTTANSAQSSRH